MLTCCYLRVDLLLFILVDLLLLQARHLSPHDTLVMANMALVQQRLALKNLRAEGSRLPTVLGAVKSLEQAQRWAGQGRWCTVVAINDLIATSRLCHYLTTG